MITFLKKYANDSFEKLVNEIHWMDLPFRLKAIFAKLPQGGGDSRPYKVYTALLTQSGTDAPIATVLENTLGGDIVWSRVNSGDYEGTLNGAFILNKTSIIVGGVIGQDNHANLYSVDDNENSVYITTFNDTVATDDLLLKTTVDIKVYK